MSKLETLLEPYAPKVVETLKLPGLEPSDCEPAGIAIVGDPTVDLM